HVLAPAPAEPVKEPQRGPADDADEVVEGIRHRVTFGFGHGRQYRRPWSPVSNGTRSIRLTAERGRSLRSFAVAATKTGKRLVIVESPAKARTISAYLGDEFVVESSVGHIRDLPTSAKEIPDKFKKEPWARLGVDVERDLEPLYVVDSHKKGRVTELRKRLADADELLLATDEDREGEAIAWHLLEVLKPKVPVRRMVFHEIT